MTHLSKKVIFIMFLLIATSTLSLHKLTNAIHNKYTLHDKTNLHHDTSITYTLYRSSLEIIKTGIVIDPPAITPTSKISLTNFTS